jgi:hypothetical protein
MKITLDQDNLAKAVITHLRAIGVTSDILKVEFRYTRVPYTVFAEVELAEVIPGKSAKVRVPIELAVPEIETVQSDPAEKPVSLVDPDTLPPEEVVPEEPKPDSPAAPLFGGGT